MRPAPRLGEGVDATLPPQTALRTDLGSTISSAGVAHAGDDRSMRSTPYTCRPHTAPMDGRHRHTPGNGSRGRRSPAPLHTSLGRQRARGVPYCPLQHPFQALSFVPQNASCQGPRTAPGYASPARTPEPSTDSQALRGLWWCVRVLGCVWGPGYLRSAWAVGCSLLSPSHRCARAAVEATRARCYLFC